MITDGSRQCDIPHDYAPFGEELAGTSNGVRSMANGFIGAEAGVRQEFTAKERDSETDLDYFGARYMSSAQGFTRLHVGYICRREGLKIVNVPLHIPHKLPRQTRPFGVFPGADQSFIGCERNL